VISTTDDGRLIDAAAVPQLFSLFGRPGDPDEVGTDLAIARRTVEQHGGVIWLEPAPGRGTTVSFTLPTENTESGGADR
jgi:signal transduction histidine kinase